MVNRNYGTSHFSERPLLPCELLNTFEEWLNYKRRTWFQEKNIFLRSDFVIPSIRNQMFSKARSCSEKQKIRTEKDILWENPFQ